jgi:predicted MFS family arabinose efflux permease
MKMARLFQSAHYRRWAAANFLSGIGDWFNSVAVLSLLLEITGSAMAVGITLALRTLPYLLFGPVGGILADRFSRKTVMVICDLVRAVIALSFLWVGSAGDLWIAYAGTFALIAFSALYNPSRMAAIPQLVGREDVPLANALEQSVFGVVMAIGSMAGGIVTGWWGTDVAFVFNSLSFLASGLLIATIPLREQPRQESKTAGEPAGQSSYRALLPLFRQAPIVPLVLVFSLLWPIGGGIVNVLISVYAYQVFDAGKAGIGLLYFSIGVGFLLGGALASRFLQKPHRFAAISFTVEGAAHLLASFASSIVTAALFFSLSTVAGGVGNACLQTLLMQNVPSRFQGRVFALEHTLSSVVIGLSMLAGGWLLAFSPPRVLGFASGLLITLMSLAIGAAIWRRGDSLPPAETETIKNHA